MLTSSVDSFPYTSLLLRSGLTERCRGDDTEDNAQSILEEHVSRVWDRSHGTTPPTARTPAGLRTPNQHRAGARNSSALTRGSKSARVTRDETASGPVPPVVPSTGVSRHGHPHRHPSLPNAAGGPPVTAGAPGRRSHVLPSTSAAVAAPTADHDVRKTANSTRRTLDSGGHLMTSMAGSRLSSAATQDSHQLTSLHTPEVTTERLLTYITILFQ